MWAIACAGDDGGGVGVRVIPRAGGCGPWAAGNGNDGVGVRAIARIGGCGLWAVGGW